MTTAKKSLGTARYLFRVMVTIEIPVLFVLVMSANATRGRDNVASGALAVVWVIALLLVAVKATSLISGERTRQTLDVLAAVPLSGREIFLQQFAGVRRLMTVLAVPFFTIFTFQAWWSYEFGMPLPDVANYLLCSLLSLLVYLPLAAWMAFYIGLRVRSQGRAILIALLVIFGWTLGPLIIPWLGLISPAWIVAFNEYSQVSLSSTLLNFAIFGMLLACVRSTCLINADRFLGRCGGPPAPSVFRTA